MELLERRDSAAAEGAAAASAAAGAAREPSEVEAAAAFYLADLGEAAGATRSELRRISAIDASGLSDSGLRRPGDPPVQAAIALGLQAIAKEREQAANIVVVAVALVRLAAVKTDVLLVLNLPHTIDAGSSVAAVLGAGPQGGGGSAVERAAEATLLRALSSLTVVNWALFSM